MSEKKVMLTREGYDKLAAKLEHLKSVRRLEVADRLKAAIALGDLSENSEYEDAKNEQGFLEGEILDLEAKLRNCEIIEEEVSSLIKPGSTVVIRDLETGDVETYMIVGTTEADPDESRISYESPLGAALLHQEVGAVVDVHAPIGVLKYEVLEIKA